jgi:hypothetical protein
MPAATVDAQNNTGVQITNDTGGLIEGGRRGITGGAVGAGDALTVTNYSFSVSPDYIFRFLGDLTANANFLALVGDTTVNGSAVSYRFDGTYTDVITPEPSTFALIGFGWRSAVHGATAAGLIVISL